METGLAEKGLDGPRAGARGALTIAQAVAPGRVLVLNAGFTSFEGARRRGPTMQRFFLDVHAIHPGVRDKIAGLHRSTVEEVAAAVAQDAVVVVGMRGNPFVRRARRRLTALGQAFRYLEYGSYLSDWRRRNALKMWTGWPTFPMVFVHGSLIGGAEDLDRLAASGELARLLAQGRGG